MKTAKLKSKINSNSLSLFATQIFHKPVLSKALIKGLLEECEIYQVRDTVGLRWSEKNYPFGYTSYGSLDQLQGSSSDFEALSKIILKSATGYFESLGYQKAPLFIQNMWINVMPAGATHSGHIHPGSHLSGTVYLSTPPGSAAIKFEDPRLGFFMNSPAQAKVLKNTQKRHFSLAPTAGDLILFESWLRHEVPTNLSKKSRVSISFNLSC